MKIQRVKLRDLETGDHIAVRGEISSLSPFLLLFTSHSDHTYLHHGIFDKEDMSVIEIHGDSKQNARPVKRDFTMFFAGHQELFRFKYGKGECFPVNVTMKMAKEAVEQARPWPPYNLLTNNCESFVLYMKHGRGLSLSALIAMLEVGAKTAGVAVFGCICYLAFCLL